MVTSCYLEQCRELSTREKGGDLIEPVVIQRHLRRHAHREGGGQGNESKERRCEKIVSWRRVRPSEFGWYRKGSDRAEPRHTNKSRQETCTSQHCLLRPTSPPLKPEQKKELRRLYI